MIDMEDEIFDAVAREVREHHPGTFVVGEELNAPPKFPCVVFWEVGNRTYRKTRTMDCVEHHAELIYEMQVFSNLHKGRKAQCRAIANTVDEYLVSHGFSRNMLEAVDNPADQNVFRFVGRYKVIADKETHRLHMR